MAVVTVTSVRPSSVFYVNWWFTDHCNWNCSYCHDELKRGLVPWPSLRDCQQAIEDITKYARTQQKTVSLDLVGGEVTLWPHLPELLTYARSLGTQTRIRTNASLPVRDFEQLLELLDSIQIDFHPEHTQTSHFMLCLDRASRAGIPVSVTMNALPDRWQEITELEQRIKNKWPQINLQLRMLFQDPIRNTKPMDYDEEQKQALTKTQGNIIITSTDGLEYTDYQTMILEKKNRFKTANCSIGIEQIIIDAWGVVRKGHCRQGGLIGHLGKTLVFDGQPVRCLKEDCSNGFDILATKQL